MLEVRDVRRCGCATKIGAMRVLRWTLGIGAVVWVAALFLAPDLLFPVGTVICHQRPERSFFVDGRQLPVCARCTGLYVGSALAAPVALLAATSAAVIGARRILVAAALPTLVTWTLEFAGLVPFANITRFVAAIPLGFVTAWLVLGELRGSRVTRTQPQHPTHLAL